MPMKRLILSAFASALLATASIAADPQAGPHPPGCPPHDGANPGGWNGGPGGRMGFLTPEARIMRFADIQKMTKGMTEDQSRDVRQAARDKLTDMTDDQRAKFAADLQARWNALPDAQKAQLRKQYEDFRAAREKEFHARCQ